MHDLFLRHPASVGETYGQHMRRAAAFGGWMALGAMCCLVHAVLPFLFERTGSGIIARLHDGMVVNRARLTGAADTAGEERRPADAKPVGIAG